MAEDSGQTVVDALFDHVLPLVPGLDARLERGIRVLDVGCGRGRALLRLAERFPRSRFEGVDLCEEPISWARAEAQSRGLSNAHFAVRDAVSERWAGPSPASDAGRPRLFRPICARHSEIPTPLVNALDLRDATLVCQDRGGPTGGSAPPERPLAPRVRSA
jgi:SAM-dependent methyltransferase